MLPLWQPLPDGRAGARHDPAGGFRRQAERDSGIIRPNLRPPLWCGETLAKEPIEWGLSQCDIVKLADNEIEFLTGQTDLVKGSAILRERFPNLRLLCVTAGAEGGYAHWQGLSVFQLSFLLGGTIETTGAGDIFCACMIHAVLERGLDGLTEADLTPMLRFANAAAYLVTTKKGAIRSMPERVQVEELLRHEISGS